LLLRDEYKKVVTGSLENLSIAGKIEVFAFVIMPNHITRRRAFSKITRRGLCPEQRHCECNEASEGSSAAKRSKAYFCF